MNFNTIFQSSQAIIFYWIILKGTFLTFFNTSFAFLHLICIMNITLFGILSKRTSAADAVEIPAVIPDPINFFIRDAESTILNIFVMYLK